MNELQEMTEGKSMFGLENELAFQLKQGNLEGGTICSHIQAEIDKMISKRINGAWYVSMIDKALSGWGGSAGKANKFIIACDTIEQAERVEANAHLRNEMKYINISKSLPRVTAKHCPTWRHADELGEIWTK